MSPGDPLGRQYLDEEVKVARFIVGGGRGITSGNLLAVNCRRNGNVLFEN